MKKLINGIVTFRKNCLADYGEKFSKLALAQQKPDALFIACCDSRVVPNVFASSDPGDLFVVRNIGNLVPPYHDIHQQPCVDISTAAAIEFSLLSLNVANVVICGHSECAAMEALLKQKSDQQLPFINTWLQSAAPSYEQFKHTTASENLSAHNHLSQINVLQQLEHLKTYPWVSERLRNHTLKIHGWWFDLASAGVYHYDTSVKDFVLIDEKEAEKILSEL